MIEGVLMYAVWAVASFYILLLTMLVVFACVMIGAGVWDWIERRRAGKPTGGTSRFRY